MYNTHKTHIIHVNTHNTHARAYSTRQKSLQMENKHSETSEKAIEAYLTRRVREEGGISLKFSSFTQTGYPDRVVMLPYGLTAWVELKSKGKKPRALQQVRHDELRAIGQPVYVIDSRPGVDEMLKELTEEAGE